MQIVIIAVIVYPYRVQIPSIPIGCYLKLFHIGNDIKSNYLTGGQNMAYVLSEDGIIDNGNLRETHFLSWTKVGHTVTVSRISYFEIDGITFEVGSKNKKGVQLKGADTGYIVKDDIEYGMGNVIPIWMFGFLY